MTFARRGQIRTRICGGIIDQSQILVIQQVVDGKFCHVSCLVDGSDRLGSFTNQTICQRSAVGIKVRSSKLDGAIVAITSNVIDESINKETKVTTTLLFADAVSEGSGEFDQIGQSSSKQNLRHIVKQGLQGRLNVGAVVSAVVISVATSSTIRVPR